MGHFQAKASIAGEEVYRSQKEDVDGWSLESAVCAV